MNTYITETDLGNDETVEIHRCPTCHGVLGIDWTFLDQVQDEIVCPMCSKEFTPSDPPE